jgi:hypothetical protein
VGNPSSIKPADGFSVFIYFQIQYFCLLLETGFYCGRVSDAEKDNGEQTPGRYGDLNHPDIAKWQRGHLRHTSGKVSRPTVLHPDLYVLWFSGRKAHLCFVITV